MIHVEYYMILMVGLFICRMIFDYEGALSFKYFSIVVNVFSYGVSFIVVINEGKSSNLCLLLLVSCCMYTVRSLHSKPEQLLTCY